MGLCVLGLLGFGKMYSLAVFSCRFGLRVLLFKSNELSALNGGVVHEQQHI
jgi:hypothetical protein